MTNLALALCFIGFVCGAVIGTRMFAMLGRRIGAAFTRRQRSAFIFFGVPCVAWLSIGIPIWMGFNFSTAGPISATLWGWSGMFFFRLMIAHKEMP